ncbi:MAG: hypothetical protein QOJ00_2477 [Actinomycetota bacterium]|jgi:sugar lactone lactonase YvrE
MDTLVDGIDFGEGPRWHDGELWYSDFYQRAIYAVTAGGSRRAVWADLDDRPSGLGWMPDGSLLVVAMTSRRLLREVDSALVEHADLSALAGGHCNDMVVAADGTAYVGNFGFDYEAREPVRSAELIRVTPSGEASVAATDLQFPNGSVIFDDTTLVVGETFGAGYTAWTIAADGTLTHRRRWAETPNMFPDGCTPDAEGAIWFADPAGSQVVRVKEGGVITDTIATAMPAYACALGGDDGTTLFVVCAPDSRPEAVQGKAQGAIYVTTVAVPHAHRP